MRTIDTDQPFSDHGVLDVPSPLAVRYATLTIKRNSKKGMPSIELAIKSDSRRNRPSTMLTTKRNSKKRVPSIELAIKSNARSTMPSTMPVTKPK